MISPFGQPHAVPPTLPSCPRPKAQNRLAASGSPWQIEDYAERNAVQREFWEGQNGQQAGDPAKLAQALLRIVGEEPPPRRFIAGADAIATAEQAIATLQQETHAFRELSRSLPLNEVGSPS